MEETSCNNTFSNILKCQNLNEEVQNLITSAIESIERKKDCISDLEEYLTSHVRKEDDIRGSYISQCMNGQNARMLKKPYFTCRLGLTPPTNIYQKQKAENCSYDYYDIKHELYKICSEKDKVIIQEAVGNLVYELEMQKIMSKKWENKSDDRVIKKLNSSSLLDLSRRCTGDMVDKISWLEISNKYLNGKISSENCKKLWIYVIGPNCPQFSEWTEKECEKLVELVDKYGSHGKWVQIAQEMPVQRAPFMFYRKWLQLNSKNETVDEWTEAEDNLLREATEIYRVKSRNRKLYNWNKIATGVSNRSAKDCEKRWSVLQTCITSRPFTGEEDMELLLLIKKIGTENWNEINRNMVQERTAEQCEERYCELVDDLIPWSYCEDRRMWISMRQFFRRHWQDGEQVEILSRNLDIFKQLVPVLENRVLSVIRYRYLKLVKWFRMWNAYYIYLCRKENKDVSEANALLSDDFSSNDFIIKKLRSILMKYCFLEFLIKILRKNGFQNPEMEAENIIKSCGVNKDVLRNLCNDPNDESLLDYFVFLNDLQHGCFVPRRFEKLSRFGAVYKNPRRVGDDLRLVAHNIIKMESADTLKISIKKEIEKLIKLDQVDEHDKEALNELLSKTGMFEAAFIFASRTLEKTQQFKLNCPTVEYKMILPRFLRLMVQYIFERRQQNIVKRYETNFSTKLEDKRKTIAQLLILRDSIGEIYKTYSQKKQCLLSKYLPTTVTRFITRKDTAENSSKKLVNYLGRLIDFPNLDQPGQNSPWNSIDLLSPNRTSLALLRNFYLQTSKLLEVGEVEFVRINKLKYDHPADQIKGLQNQNCIDPKRLQADKKESPLCDWRYLLLRSRILSILALPAVISQLSISAVQERADRLHENQNDVRDSTLVSRMMSKFDLTNLTEKNTKKRVCKEKKKPILQCLDDMCEYPNESDVETTVHSNNSIKNPINNSSSLYSSSILNEPEDDIENSSLKFVRLTRKTARKWLKICLPGSQRIVFIPREILNFMYNNNYEIESICGKNVSQLISENRE